MSILFEATEIKGMTLGNRFVRSATWEGMATPEGECPTRPVELIREPHLVKRWAEGDLRKAACLSDSQCFGPAMAGDGITCVVEQKERTKGGK